MSKQSKAIIIYKKCEFTGGKYPVCSKCLQPVFSTRFTKDSIETVVLWDANYCPYCGSKFIKRGINNV